MIYIGVVNLSDLEDRTYKQLYDRASSERRCQADRCFRIEDSHRCIVADGLLRYVLRKSFGTDQVTLCKTKAGKPYLVGREDFHFNLSHSGNWVVIAWADRAVGIDVEFLRSTENKDRLAQRFFHPQEQAYLAQARGQEWAWRFFEIWTKKESYLKYLGTGIDRALNSFSVFDLPEVSFISQRLEDALLTLCASNAQCQIISLTPEMLLPG